MKPTAADTQLSFTLPYDLDSGNYKLYVFSEQCNGDYKTDYASRFQAVALTVEEAANEQFDLVPGGRYYFDLSAMGIPGTANGSLPGCIAALCSLYLHWNSGCIHAHVEDGNHRCVCREVQISPQPVCGRLCRKAYGKLE